MNELTRLGKHEKKILETLRIWKSANPQWEWTPNSGYLQSLAGPYDIERYGRGEIVPVWMLRRDVVHCKATLARSLRTLEEKGFVTLLAGWLDDKYCPGGRRHTKFVSMNEKAKR